MEITKKQSLSEAFKIYLDKRMLKILLLGAISGLEIIFLNIAVYPSDGIPSYFAFLKYVSS